VLALLLSASANPEKGEPEVVQIAEVEEASRLGADAVVLFTALAGQSEPGMIRTLAAFNIRGERREDRVGVWVRRPDKGDGREDKIAAIGIRVKRWVSLHGVALNVEPELAHFQGIVPCGVSEQRFGVTSLIDLGVPVTMLEVDMVLRRQFEALFGQTWA